MATPVAFPAARPDRAEPFTSLGGPTAPAVPVVRLWPFALEEVTPGDRNATSPFLNGPAVVESVFLNWQDDNTNPKPTIALFYGPSLPPSGNAVLTIAQLGTPIFTDGVISTESAGVYQTPIQHLSKFVGAAGQTGRQQYTLRFPIMLDQFQLLIRFGTQTAGSQALHGYIRVLERVPPELIANFL